MPLPLHLMLHRIWSQTNDLAKTDIFPSGPREMDSDLNFSALIFRPRAKNGLFAYSETKEGGNVLRTLKALFELTIVADEHKPHVAFACRKTSSISVQYVIQMETSLFKDSTDILILYFYKPQFVAL